MARAITVSQRCRPQWSVPATRFLASLTPDDICLLAELMRWSSAATKDFLEERGYSRGVAKALILIDVPDEVPVNG